MVVKSSLSGLKVLITRPQHQAQALCDYVNEARGEAIVFPTIEIKPLNVAIDKKTDIKKFDIVIFVSRNSADYFNDELQHQLAKDVLVIAIGATTAHFLQMKGLSNIAYPSAPAGSEAVLAMSELQDVSNKHVLIVRGQGGRELLAETLTMRGADTHYLEVYQRVMPQPSTEMIEQAKLAETIVIFSVNSLDNLCILIGKENLINKNLIVVSNRIKQYAMRKGFKYIDVAEDAGDGAVMRQIIKGGQENVRK